MTEQARLKLQEMKAALQRTQESAERAYQLAVVIALNKAKAKVRAERVRTEITRLRMT
ncbi:MAG: hypothetical protein JO316_00515 [Abitibacteriaceae bacterium]|nr:hypothetical protein [Abditibacteriaceae bacterium]MBV9863809.1 hypothetical protein [Abditibacteriaceae bacterium]